MPPPLFPPEHLGALSVPWLARANTLHRVVQIDVRKVLAQTLLWGVAFAILLAIPFALYFQSETRGYQELRKAERERNLRLAQEVIREEMDVALSDLRFLSKSNEMAMFLGRGDADSRRVLAREFLSFARQKRIYDQVRLLGTDGMELVRVNFHGGSPRVVPGDELQHKGGREYFRAALALDASSIYVSPLDLNIENGALEIPHKPMIRFAMPVVDSQGRKLGVLVLNYLGQLLLDRLALIGGESREIWLLNGQGYWLLGGPSESEAGSLTAGRQRSRLPERYPELWANMSGHDRGAQAVSGALIQFEKVYPFDAQPPSLDLAHPVAGKTYFWIVATVLRTESLAAAEHDTGVRLGIMYAVWACLGFALAGGISFLGNRHKALAQVMENVIDNLPVLIAYVDADRRYRFNNLAYERFFGLSPRQLFGKTLREVLGEASYLEMLPYVEQALSGQAVNLERRLPYARAGNRDVVISYIPDVQSGGRVRGFYVVVNDVTPIRESERRERQQLLELAHVSRLASLGEMASQIAHEINQPLAAIAMYSSACLRARGNAEAGSQIKEWLEAINAQAKRAGEVVRHLRRFVRKGDIQSGPVDLNQVASEVVNLLQAEAGRQNVTLVIEAATDMPLLAAELILVEQVLVNIVRNALEALSGREGERRVVIRTGFDETSAWVEVQDNGPGVDPALGEHIFEPFMTDKRAGLGMGLAISRSIVSAHGGTLTYGGSPGGGALFRCVFLRKISP